MADRSEAFVHGERRHETCRFGRLTEAWVLAKGRETPDVAPLCTYQPKGPVPPALTRAWGGLIEYERDCALCDAYQALEVPHG